jgi:hypothetical protein
LTFAKRNAWLNQIELVQQQLQDLDGWIAFEFAIPRMGKRADVVLVTAGIVFVLEFKVGAHQFDAAAFDQVIDYALDLKNFHAGSHDRKIVPVVVATMADDLPLELAWGADDVAGPIASNGSNLRAIIAEVAKQIPVQAGIWQAVVA